MNPLILDTHIDFESPVIIALDYTSESEVINLISQLDPGWCKLKIGKSYSPPVVPN